MYVYLVVKEVIEDGSWLNDPETFDFRGDAEKYAIGREDHLKPGEIWALYECRRANVVRSTRPIKGDIK